MVAELNSQDRKRLVRRSALWLAALAIAFYVGFILISVVRAT